MIPSNATLLSTAAPVEVSTMATAALDMNDSGTLSFREHVGEGDEGVGTLLVTCRRLISFLAMLHVAFVLFFVVAIYLKQVPMDLRHEK